MPPGPLKGELIFESKKCLLGKGSPPGPLKGELYQGIIIFREKIRLITVKQKAAYGLSITPVPPSGG